MISPKLKANGFVLSRKLDSQPEILANFSLLAAKFPRLNFCNLVLLMVQYPKAIHLIPAADCIQRKIPIVTNRWAITLYEPALQVKIERDEKYIPLMQSTKDERYKLRAGNLKSEEEITVVPVQYFDLTQTKIPTKEYPYYIHPQTNNIPPDLLHNSIQTFAERLGFNIVVKDFPSHMTRSHYYRESSTIQLRSQSDTTSLLHELATGILYKTSTSKTNPLLRDWETEILFAGLCTNYGIPYYDDLFIDHLEGICQKIQKSDFDCDPDTSLSRIDKSRSFADTGILDCLKSSKEHLPAQNINENFMQGL